MNSIFANEKVFTYADPLTTWIFNVSFYYYDGGDGSATNAYNEFLKDVIATSITLPEFKTTMVTKKFFGTEKSFPVLRTYGKDVTMTFNLYADKSINEKIGQLTQINALRGTAVNNTTYDYLEDLDHPESLKGGSTIITDSNQTNGILAYHPELTTPSDGLDFISKFNMVEVSIKDKTGQDVYKIRYKYCNVTNFEFDNELNYDSDTKLRCKLTFHSDIWTFAPIGTVEHTVVNDDPNASRVNVNQYYLN